MEQVTVTGMILSSAPIGEYDKRVVILTREKGKLSVFAKGARRPNSPLVGAVSPFSFGEFTIYEGRSSYTMYQARITNYFAGLREDVEGAYYGFYFLEIADYYGREYNDERQLINLLYVTIHVLEKRRLPYRLIRCIYELKSVCVNGEGPQVFSCRHCGAREGMMSFSPTGGGIYCENCQVHVTDGILLNQSALHALQVIVSSSMEKLYSFTVSEEVLEILERVSTQYLEMHTDRKFKSVEMLGLFQN